MKVLICQKNESKSERTCCNSKEGHHTAFWHQDWPWTLSLKTTHTSAVLSMMMSPNPFETS